MNSADFFDDNSYDRLVGGRDYRTSSRMPRGVDLMARHSGPALPTVVWLSLASALLALTLVATVRAIDRSDAADSPAAVSQPAQSHENGFKVHGTQSDLSRENAGNLARTKVCRLAPGELLVLVSEDPAGNVHRFRLTAAAIPSSCVAGAITEPAEATGPAESVDETEFVCKSGSADSAKSSSCANSVNSDARDKSWSLGFSSGTNFSSPLKSPVFFKGWGRAGMLGLPFFLGVNSGATMDLAWRAVAEGESLAGNSALPKRRLFQLPRLSGSRTASVCTDCQLVGSAGGIGVYSEDWLRGPADRLGQRIPGMLGSGLLLAIEQALGPLLDVDGSGGLTIVVGDLDPQCEAGEFPLWGCVRESDFLDAATGSGGDILYLDESVADVGEQDLRALLVHELAHGACFSRLLERRLAGGSELLIPRWFHEGLAHVLEHAIAGERSLSRRRLEACWQDPGVSPVMVNPQSVSWSSSRQGPRAAAYRFLAAAGVDRLPAGRVANLLREAGSFEDLLFEVLGGATAPALRRWGVFEARALLDSHPDWIPPLQSDVAMESRVLGSAFAVWRGGASGLDVQVTATDDSDWTLTVIRP
ncbi:MAG TPA: hypothetical protein DIT89_16250 [Planctomycetaceae bacterium]|nr:hypothetical protein [Planctomycetaceae bacterium]